MSGPVDDQILLHDERLISWLQSDFDMLPGKSVQYLYSTPHRAYAEVSSGQLVTQEMLKYPRITISRGPHVNDPMRHNSNTIRKLGWADDEQRALIRAEYPAPTNISYQIDFWCEFVREMNLWEQKLLWQFRPQYKYFTINIDPIWDDKKFCTFLESGLDSSGNEDGPGMEGRALHRIAGLRAESWLYDQEYQSINAVRRIDIEVYDYVTEQHIETYVLKQNNLDLYTTVGGQTVFTGNSVDFAPIIENTFLLTATIGGIKVAALDDGNGNLIGPSVSSGTIDYNTGAVAITYTTAPDAGNLEATYQSV